MRNSEDLRKLGIRQGREDERGWKVLATTPSGLPLEVGDLIVKAVGLDVSRVGPLSFAALLEYAELEGSPLVVDRGGQVKAITLSDSTSLNVNEGRHEKSALGATFKHVEDTQRIIVTEIEHGSTDDSSGLKIDDELLALDGKPVGGLPPEQIADHLNGAGQRPMHIRVRREGHTYDLNLSRAAKEKDSESWMPQKLPFPLHTRGEPAPPFTLPDLDGTSVSLHDFLGKPVLLTFWGTWCRPCLAEADLFVKLNKEFGPRLVILGLDVHDEPHALRYFLQVRKLSYPVLMAGEFNSRVPKSYDVGALPLTLIIDPKGFVTYVQTGLAPNSPLESRVRTSVRNSEK